MKVVFAHDHYFYNDGLGNYYSSGKLPYQAWDRYLKVFNELVVLGREKIISKPDDTKLLNISSGPNVTFQTLPNVNQLSAILSFNKEAKDKIRKTLINADALIARLPSRIGSLSVNVAQELGLPYAIEMVGDPWNAYWYHGNWKGKVFAPVYTYNTKKQVSSSEFVLYVTESYLQERYPCAKYIESCSNVEIGSSKITVLEDRIKKINEGSGLLTIGLIGSLDANYKGIDTALRALNFVKKDLPSFKFRILGDGDKNKWEKTALDLGLEEAVIFDGVLPKGKEVECWIDDIDIYIQPSLTEGLPRALVESMSRGCPAVGSTAGGIPELLKDTSCLHKPKDYKRLGELILNASLNKEWQVESAKRNFEYASNFYKEKLEAKRLKFWGKFKSYCKK